MFVHNEQRTLALEDIELCPYRTAFIHRPRSQTTIKNITGSRLTVFVQFMMDVNGY